MQECRSAEKVRRASKRSGCARSEGNEGKIRDPEMCREPSGGSKNSVRNRRTGLVTSARNMRSNLGGAKRRHGRNSGVRMNCNKQKKGRETAPRTIAPRASITEAVREGKRNPERKGECKCKREDQQVVGTIEDTAGVRRKHRTSYGTISSRSIGCRGPEALGKDRRSSTLGQAYATM